MNYRFRNITVQFIFNKIALINYKIIILFDSLIWYEFSFDVDINKMSYKGLWRNVMD